MPLRKWQLQSIIIQRGKKGGAVMRLVSIYNQEELRKHGLLVKPETLRIWKCKGKFVKDGLFVKLGHRLLIDLDALERILKREQQKMVELGKRMHRAGQGKAG
ncbi:hypothetical protein DRN74_05755 [Candidatus Micrarchaeota archaeon]|nr:MAG: hypothetical protein DRN74_05755 [Candidatus Micrarchaeota archaeon]